MKIDTLLKRYRVDEGKHSRLKDYDPSDTHGLKSEQAAEGGVGKGEETAH